MPRVRSRSPDYQRKWYWYQDPATGWWSWHYHALDWTPKVQGGAASSTGGQPEMNESKEKEAVVDMNESKEKEAVVDMKESKEKQAVVDMDVDG